MLYQKRETEGYATRVYRYKLRPKPAQVELMAEYLETLRRLYNSALWERNLYSIGLRLVKADAEGLEKRQEAEAWCLRDFGENAVNEARPRAAEIATLPTDEERKATLAAWQAETNLYSQKKRLITEQRHAGHEYLSRVNFGCATDCLTRLDRAFQAFFRRLKSGEDPGYPRFRRRGEYDTCGYLSIGNGCKFDAATGRVTLQHIGTMRTMYYRPLPERAIVRTLSWSHRADGWWLQVTIQVPEEDLPRADVPAGRCAVGIHVGDDPYYVAVDERGEVTTVAPLLPLTASLEQLAMRQQRLSRRVKGSTGRRQAAHLVGRAHQHVAAQRKEWMIVAANTLLERYAVVVLEDLPLRRYLAADKGGGKEERIINRETVDHAWGMFREKLQAQAPKYGSRVVLIPPLPSNELAREERAAQILATGLAAAKL